MASTLLLFFLSPLLKALTLSMIVGAGGIALYLFTPAFVPGKFRNVCGIVGICALSGGAFYWWAFHAGEQHAYQKIAAKDKAAVERVETVLKDVRNCNGGVDWDVVTGTCNPTR